MSNYYTIICLFSLHFGALMALLSVKKLSPIELREMKFYSWVVSFTKTNNFFLKIFTFCFVNSKKVLTFVHSSKFIGYGIKNCLSLAVKPRITLSA